MLKNKIKYKNESQMFSMKGNLQVFGFDKDKRLIHIDRGDNVVTNWAKQTIMKTFGGFGYLEAQPDVVAQTDYINMTTSGAAHSASVNSDGYSISSQQFFEDVGPEQIRGTKAADLPDTYQQFYPTKMLFGTGMEIYDSGSGVMKIHFTDGGTDAADYTFSSAEFAKLIGYGSALEINNIISTIPGGIGNNYSDVYASVTPFAPSSFVRTVDSNDPTLIAKIKNTGFSADNYSIAGAIKNNGYTAEGTVSTIFSNYPENDDYVINLAYRGVGRPAFVHIDRSLLDLTSTSSVYVNKTSGAISNRITFQVTLPNQTGPNYYYPYNGYYIREAGLFSDARFYSDNLTGSNLVPIEGDEPEVFKAYRRMLYGMLLAKRRIATIYKAHDNSFTFQWTLYIE